MYDFKFGNAWISELGAKCAEEPGIEIAQRDVSFVDVPGKDGSDCIDNGRYKNVEVKRKIALVGRKEISADEKAAQLVNHFAYLQGYQEFEDSDHEGLITQAALTNFSEITKSLRTMRTAELIFTRKPYWYLKSSLEEINVDAATMSERGLEIYNPFPCEAKPTILIYVKVSANAATSSFKPNLSISSTYNGVYTTKEYSSASVKYNYPHSIIEYDLENQRVLTRSADGDILCYTDMDIPSPIGPGKTLIKLSSNKTISSVSVIPGWRCL